jgi:hypothetical protein
VHNTSDQDLSAMYQFLSVADMADKEDIAPCLVTDLAMYHKYMDLFLALPFIVENGVHYGENSTSF